MNRTQQWIVVFGLSLVGCATEAGDHDAELEALAQQDAALCGNALLPAEEETVLQWIDNICGDTWCEGDHNFAFDDLTCRAGGRHAPQGGSCTLSLRLLPHDGNGVSYARTCTTRGFFGFDSLADTSDSGYQSINWDYYLALTACIARLEAELPR